MGSQPPQLEGTELDLSRGVPPRTCSLEWWAQQQAHKGKTKDRLACASNLFFFKDYDGQGACGSTGRGLASMDEDALGLLPSIT